MNIDKAFPIALLFFLAMLANPAQTLATAKETNVIKVQLASQMPVRHPLTHSLDLFCKTVADKCSGQLIISHFPSGQLLTDKEIPKAISKGSIKMAQTLLYWWAGLIFDIYPYGGNQIENNAHYQRLVDGPLGLHWENRMREKVGVKIIAPLLYSTINGYILNREVRKPGDMQGMKIRIPTKELAAEVIAMGGTPVVLSSADVYMALQRGTIQGAASGITSFYARKWYEVSKHVLVIKPKVTEFHIVANLKWFEALPADLQNTLLETGKMISKINRGKILKLEKKLSAALEAKGVSFVRIEPKDYQDNFAPVLQPALRRAAIEQFGTSVVDKWDTWVKNTR